MERARWRCQAVEGGERCRARGRLYADHIIEIEDGGAKLDPGNGQALCHAHHEAKTAAARAARR